MRRHRAKQEHLPFKQRGGRRPGAGRKPKGDKPMMPHNTRPPVSRHYPIHVTVRLLSGLPSLRQRLEALLLLKVFQAAKDRFGFRLIHFIVEAENRKSLWRGMKGLQVRIARALNKLWGRRGSVFSDRYHAHILKTPREVRHALVYVLHNAKKHVGDRLRKKLDEFTSCRVFDGWKETVKGAVRAIREAVAEARTWLLVTGWRRRGLLSVHERPAALE